MFPRAIRNYAKTVQVGYTVQCLPYIEDGFDMDVDIECEFVCNPPEKANYNYPGWPATAEFVDYHIESIKVYDNEGLLVNRPIDDKTVRNLVDSYLNDNPKEMEYLETCALENADSPYWPQAY